MRDTQKTFCAWMSLMPLLHKSITVAALFTCSAAAFASTPYSSDEHQRLVLVLRQLDAADRLLSSMAPTAADLSARYAFDYALLSADLNLIRQGINGYLTPSRAQPRNPPELTGHYTRSSQDQQ